MHHNLRMICFRPVLLFRWIFKHPLCRFFAYIRATANNFFCLWRKVNGVNFLLLYYQWFSQRNSNTTVSTCNCKLWEIQMGVNDYCKSKRKQVMSSLCSSDDYNWPLSYRIGSDDHMKMEAHYMLMFPM